MKITNIPHCYDAEKSIIGCLLIDFEATLPHCLNLSSEIFYNQTVKRVFDFIVTDKITDIVSINSHFPASVEPVKALLNCCLEYTPTARYIKSHIETVTEKYRLRKILKNNYDNVTKIMDNNLSTEEYITENKSLLTDVLPDIKSSFDLKSSVKTMLAQVSNNESHGIKTGYHKLDNKIGGLIASDLIVIGGRPSMGKTALAVGMISNILHQNKRILFFSLEMSTPKILRRIMSMRTGIVLETLKNGQADNAKMGKLVDASQKLINQKLVIDDRPGLTADDITAKSLTEDAKETIDLIVIDYLQRMKHKRGQGISESSQIGETVIEMKSLAKSLNVPVILLSQLSRASTYRQDKSPVMADLRGSGDIEQEADIVIFPYRPLQEMETESQTNFDRLIIAKHRDGGLGIAPITWIPGLAIFDNKYSI